MFPIIKTTRKGAGSLLKTFISLATYFMVYQVLKVICGNPNPLTVVLSGSMEPAFARGDLLIVWGTSSPVVGDIVIYNVDHMPFPIVHRVIGTFIDEGQTKLLTKGDNNNVDDSGLYPKGQDYLSPDAVVGSVVGMIPFVGYVTVAMSDYPWLRMVLLGLFAFYTLLQDVKDDSCKVRSDRIEPGDDQEPSTPEEAPAPENRSCSSGEQNKPYPPLSTSTASALLTTDDAGTIEEFQPEDHIAAIREEVGATLPHCGYWWRDSLQSLHGLMDSPIWDLSRTIESC